MQVEMITILLEHFFKRESEHRGVFVFVCVCESCDHARVWGVESWQK